jgi:acetyl esterase/lipase
MLPWLFLILAVWCAVLVLVSYLPPRKPALLMGIGFFAAWTTTEMAPIYVLGIVAGVTVLIIFGALSMWPGWVALAIAIGSLFWLGASVRGALRTNQVFLDALQEGLGPGWDANLDPALEEAGRHVSWGRVLLPFWFRRRGVQRVRNIQYVDDGSRRHRLDIYRPKNVREGMPVLLQIHGGGWMISNKDQQGKPLQWHLAKRGWVCVAINYRLSPKATWPDHLVDCKRALAWIREHIAEHGGDPDYVVVTGGSAGGHLTAMMGLTPNDPEYQPGFEDVDTTVRAMMPFYGVFDWTGSWTGGGKDNGLQEILEKYVVKQKLSDAPEVFASASPINRITPDAPRTMIVHGELDTLAPIPMARAFAAKLRMTSRHEVVYVELKGAHHAFDVYNSIRTMHSITGVDLFLAWLIRVDPPGSRSLDVSDPADTAASEPAASDPKPRVRTER